MTCYYVQNRQFCHADMRSKICPSLEGDLNPLIFSKRGATSFQ